MYLPALSGLKVSLLAVLPRLVGIRTEYIYHGLQNLDLLDSVATDHAHNSRDTFISFFPTMKEAFGATGERVISYGRGNISKKFADQTSRSFPLVLARLRI